MFIEVYRGNSLEMLSGSAAVRVFATAIASVPGLSFQKLVYASLRMADDTLGITASTWTASLVGRVFWPGTSELRREIYAYCERIFAKTLT